MLRIADHLPFNLELAKLEWSDCRINMGLRSSGTDWGGFLCPARIPSSSRTFIPGNASKRSAASPSAPPHGLPAVHQARSLPRDQFKREVDQHLTGKDTEPTETVYFKFYRSQIPVIEQAIEAAALMLGTDKSRGYCLEMICADLLAGANLGNGQPDALLFSIARFFPFLPGEQRQAFVEQITEKAS